MYMNFRVLFLELHKSGMVAHSWGWRHEEQKLKVILDYIVKSRSALVLQSGSVLC